MHSADGAPEAHRERRSRDRYGRERREREPRADAVEPTPAAASADAAPVAEWVSTEPANLAAVILGAEAVMGGGVLTGNTARDNAADVEEAPAAQAPVASPVAAPAPLPAAPVESAPAPTVALAASYTLPMDELQQIAQSSGLEWVNSDAAKVAQAQASIATQPAPVRVPRERPAPVALYDGPLVLVETKRDLRQVTMPFDNTGIPPAA